MNDTIVQLREALEEIADGTCRHGWNPDFQRCVDIARYALKHAKDAAMTEPTREALTAELAALDARKAEVQAQLDKMPVVYRGGWCDEYPDSLSPDAEGDTHYIEWTVENGVPRVLGDFKRIGG